MLARLVASWLVVLAFLPFTAPFSTLTLNDVLDGASVQPYTSATVPVSPGAAIEAPEQSSNFLRADVRPVASSHYDMRLMPSVLPPACALDSPLDICDALIARAAPIPKIIAIRFVRILRL
jgi:hypothetical protein